MAEKQAFKINPHKGINDHEGKTFTRISNVLYLYGVKVTHFHFLFIYSTGGHLLKTQKVCLNLQVSA